MKILYRGYVPPTQSKFLNDEEILNLESEMTSVCRNKIYVIVIGDVTARTAKLNDFVIANNFLSDFFFTSMTKPSLFCLVPLHYGVPL